MNTMNTMNPDQSQTQIDGGFLATLQHHQGGDCLSDLSEQLRIVTEAVMLTGKPGKLTLTLTLKPANTSRLALVMEDDIKTTLPKVEKRASIHFVDEAFNLLRDNPKQLGLDLKVVPGGSSETAAPLKIAVNQ